MSTFRSLKSLTVTTALAGMLALGGAAGVLAQDEESATDHVHPTHIHEGTCDDLTPSPAAPLDDLTAWMNDEEDEDTDNSPQGVLTASMMLRSETDIDMSLEDILANPHSINVHESEENIENYIACGEIGGIVVDSERSTVGIGLSPVNDSGYYGVAFLEENDDETNVTVWLAEPRVEDEDTAATPES